MLNVDADDEYAFDDDGLTGADLEELDDIERNAYQGARKSMCTGCDS